MIYTLLDAAAFILEEQGEQSPYWLSSQMMEGKLWRASEHDVQAALEQDINELDSLIDEILLMSRLDSGAKLNKTEAVDLLALAAEECNRHSNVELTGEPVEVVGDAKLSLQNLIPEPKGV